MQNEFLPTGARRAVSLQNADYIVHVARLMPIKHQATLLRAIADVPDAHAVLVGDVPLEQDTSYRNQLEQLVDDLGIGDRVTLTGSQPPEVVRDWYRRAAVAVNLSPAGLFDKAALESMAVGVPTIVSNPAFVSLLGDEAPFLCIPAPDDDGALAERLKALLELSEAERTAIGERLRKRVVAAHSLEALIPRLIHVLTTGEPEQKLV
jgi:glycosyltransferase involved in cell wall biosynthesis